MSINFATLQGLTIPEGVVTEIKDASGRVLWMLSGGKVILEVEKITSDTYAGETTYTGEQFILLDVYPKTNGTVSVTYGGLTKTITDTSGAAKPNAQQVFFGTFNGISDSVTTPASGELTIEGDYYAFGEGSFSTAKMGGYGHCSCTRNIVSFGLADRIPIYAFGTTYSIGNTKLTNVKIPNSITEILTDAFSYCTGLISVTIPNSVTSLGGNPFSGCINLRNIIVGEGNEGITLEGGAFFDKDKTTINGYPSATGHYDIPDGVDTINGSAFEGCTGLTSVTIPDSVKLIHINAFTKCSALTSVVFENTSGWYVSTKYNATSGTNVDVTDASANVKLITETYDTYYWRRS